MRPRFWSSLLPVTLAASFLVCGPAWADVIVLLSGCTLQGTLADREAFASNPRAGTEIAILLDTSSEAQPQLRRVPSAEIDFVVLETNGEKHVFDVRNAQASPPAPSQSPGRFPYTEAPLPTPPGPQRSHRTQTGLGLLFGGAAVALLGAVVDFSPERSVSWSPSYGGFDSGMQYDVPNYVLMGVGGVMMVAGLVIVAGPSESARPAVGIEIDRGDTVLAYRHAF